MATYVHTIDGLKKVDLDKATLLGDVLRDLHIDRQGDNSQLWQSAKGSYFTGSCLDQLKGSGKTSKYRKIFPISKEQAKVWVIDYYGASSLPKFGFTDDATDDAEEI